MAYINLDIQKLEHNYNTLNRILTKENISWSVVSKLLCGHKAYLEKLLELGISQICDSRITNLKIIKSISPEIETVFIKPPAKRHIPAIVEFADISFNTEFNTIQLLSREALRQNKTHKIMIMIELGELREGVMREDFIDFYASVYRLPNIEVVGIGTNLNCMSGILPNTDKLQQLCLYKEIIEARFGKALPYISGGTSVTLPLLGKNLIPAAVNHFRVGESLFLGTDVYHDKDLSYLHQDVFRVYAEIIEIQEKPNVPDGQTGTDLSGEPVKVNHDLGSGNSSYRAIVDIGLLDVEKGHIQPTDQLMQIAGASSDMLVVDLGDNPGSLKLGDIIEFKTDYIATLRIMNSKYVDKRIVPDLKPGLVKNNVLSEQELSAKHCFN